MSTIRIATSQVSQTDLENVINLRNRMHQTAVLLSRIEESVLMRIVGGSEVEPGIHQAWIDTAIKGRCRRQKLEVR